MTAKLDIVGAQEAAQILGIEVPRISRWIKGGKMPPVAADLKATRVWWREDIEALRDGKPWGKHPRVQIIGRSEADKIVRDELGVSKRAVSRWMREGVFPEPMLEKRDPRIPWEPGLGLAATPVWKKGDVVRFVRARARQAVAA